jgi:hypothetical protein
MDIQNIAIGISLFSVAIASVSLGWNIYRDVILKAKVDVSFAVVALIHETLPERPQFVNFKVTNFGPGPVNISMIHAKYAPMKYRLLRKTEHAVINPDYKNPHSAKLPAKIEVADKIELFLPYNSKCLLNREWTHVGVNDYYGRVHWAPKKQLLKARKQWLEEFEKIT